MNLSLLYKNSNTLLKDLLKFQKSRESASNAFIFNMLLFQRQREKLKMFFIYICWAFVICYSGFLRNYDGRC